MRFRDLGFERQRSFGLPGRVIGELPVHHHAGRREMRRRGIRAHMQQLSKRFDGFLLLASQYAGVAEHVGGLGRGGVSVEGLLQPRNRGLVFGLQIQALPQQQHRLAVFGRARLFGLQKLFEPRDRFRKPMLFVDANRRLMSGADLQEETDDRPHRVSIIQ